MSGAPIPGKADDKDWTWVLDQACDECGASVGALPVAAVAVLNVRCADKWIEVLGRDEAWVRARPEPDTWSPLEYACHVRDVFTLFLERLELMLAEDDPMFENWNPNVTAEAERYDTQEPKVVAGELAIAAAKLGDRFAGLGPKELERTGRRSDGASFTVETFAQYEIHDPLHHLWDVTGKRQPT